jgi:hypothetical protein
MLKLLAAALVLTTPSMGPEWRNLKPVAVKGGENRIADIAGDGKAGTIRIDHRENGNAWGYNIYTVTVDGSVAAVGDKDRFTDSPHTGEDVITSVRFARGLHQGKPTTFALVATRAIRDAVPDPAPTSIAIYALVRNDGGIGTPYEFARVAEVKAKRLYCHADKALEAEVGLPLPEGYGGGAGPDGCI